MTPRDKTVRKTPAKLQPSEAANSRVCSFCGQQSAREVLVPQVFGRGEQLLVIENVPTMGCDNCGESYFTGATLDELERILSNQDKLAQTRPVQVARFVTTAA